MFKQLKGADKNEQRQPSLYGRYGKRHPVVDRWKFWSPIINTTLLVLTIVGLAIANDRRVTVVEQRISVIEQAVIELKEMNIELCDKHSQSSETLAKAVVLLDYHLKEYLKVK
jgi:hypothetical protein